MTSIKKVDTINCIDYAQKNKLFDRLNDIYNSVPSGTCKGCGNCCMESVGINLIEFLNILMYLQENKKISNKCMPRVIDYYFLEYTKKNACPFKDENNRCMIYEVRPLNCRIFGHWKKEDYNRNLENVTQKNKDYQKLINSKYGFNINNEVVNYKIKYCEDFVPKKEYLDKSKRLDFADKLMVLDSTIFSKDLIDIDFKDRGIVEYFIEYLLSCDVAYNVKIRVSKDDNVRDVAIKRLKKLLLQQRG